MTTKPKAVNDDELIREAQEIGHHTTKREAVRAALEEYIRYHRQLKVLDLAGTIDYDDDYDYKAERRRR